VVSCVARVERICGRGLDSRSLRTQLLVEIRSEIPFDSYAWLLTDPETNVGSAPLADTPSLADIPRLIRLKYLTTTNRWTRLRANVSATLIGATAGHPAQSRVWTELLQGYGIDDVASIVFRDQHGCWGFLDLWRRGPAFSPGECDVLNRVTEVVTPSLRRSLLPTFERGLSAFPHQGGPVVLLLSDALGLLTQTPQTDSYLRALLPTDIGQAPVPAAAYNVAAQLLACEEGVDDNPPSARVHLGDGRWVTLRAARMEGAGPVEATTIAVSIEPTGPTERTTLFSRVAGLTDRESELLQHLVGGADTRALAQRLYVSENTVQDHLKSIFARTGANNRRVLVARATGAA
jgi:DNA-binding CsgD family transcriptional regulator